MTPPENQRMERPSRYDQSQSDEADRAKLWSIDDDDEDTVKKRNKKKKEREEAERKRPHPDKSKEGARDSSKSQEDKKRESGSKKSVGIIDALVGKDDDEQQEKPAAGKESAQKSEHESTDAETSSGDDSEKGPEEVIDESEIAEREVELLREYVAQHQVRLVEEAAGIADGLPDEAESNPASESAGLYPIQKAQEFLAKIQERLSRHGDIPVAEADYVAVAEAVLQDYDEHVEEHDTVNKPDQAELAQAGVPVSAELDDMSVDELIDDEIIDRGATDYGGRGFHAGLSGAAERNLAGVSSIGAITPEATPTSVPSTSTALRPKVRTASSGAASAGAALAGGVIGYKIGKKRRSRREARKSAADSRELAQAKRQIDHYEHVVRTRATRIYSAEAKKTTEAPPAVERPLQRVERIALDPIEPPKQAHLPNEQIGDSRNVSSRRLDKRVGEQIADSLAETIHGSSETVAPPPDLPPPIFRVSSQRAERIPVNDRTLTESPMGKLRIDTRHMSTAPETNDWRTPEMRLKGREKTAPLSEVAVVARRINMKGASLWQHFERGDISEKYLRKIVETQLAGQRSEALFSAARREAEAATGRNLEKPIGTIETGVASQSKATPEHSPTDADVQQFESPILADIPQQATTSTTTHSVKPELKLLRQAPAAAQYVSIGVAAGLLVALALIVWLS
jgi:hypothetical protein